MLCRWFVGLSMDDPIWSPTAFSKNRDRLLASDIAAAYSDGVLAHTRAAGLLSDIVSYGSPTVTGGTAPVVTSCTPPSGSAFSVGSTVVTCPATGAVHRTANCSFPVTVTLPSPRLGVTTILAFGDSITEGEVPVAGEFFIRPQFVEPDHSYPANLTTLLAQRYTAQGASRVDAFTFILSSDSNDCTPDERMTTGMFARSRARMALMVRPAVKQNMTGRRERPAWRRLVGLANVDAVNRGVEAREPAFGLVADGLLVLQMLIGARVHGEDDQECVGDGLVRGGRCCHCHFVLLGTAMCGSFANHEEPTITGPGVRTRGRRAAAKRRAFGMGVTARCSAGATLPARRWSRCDADARRPRVGEDNRPPGQHGGHRAELVGHCRDIEREHVGRLVGRGAHELTDGDARSASATH